RDAEEIEEAVSRDLAHVRRQLLPANAPRDVDQRSGDPRLGAHGERSAGRRSGSLDVLYLLAELLGLGLRAEHQLADREVARLGAGRGELTVHLLEEELDPLADRPTRRERSVERGQMACQPDQLLGDVAPL